MSTRFQRPVTPRVRGMLVRKFAEFTGKTRKEALAELMALKDDEWEWRRYIVAALNVKREHPDCPQCATRDSATPRHDGSRDCKSGSIASGGPNAHCTCDTCY